MRRARILEEVEGRLVSPVDVFDDEDGRRGCEFIEDGGEERRTIRIAIEERAERRCVCWAMS